MVIISTRCQREQNGQRVNWRDFGEEEMGVLYEIFHTNRMKWFTHMM
jgi:hypothetical protein